MQVAHAAHGALLAFFVCVRKSLSQIEKTVNPVGFTWRFLAASHRHATRFSTRLHVNERAGPGRSPTTSPAESKENAPMSNYGTSPSAPAVARASRDPVSLITPEVQETYRRDGVVFLPQVLDPEWLLLIEMGIARIMGSGSPTIQRFFRGLPGEFVDAVRHFAVTPEFQRLLYDSPIADMIARLIGSPRIWLLFDHVFVKDGGPCRKTPWHQDLPYWPVAGEQIASMWITIDPIPKAECLEFVPGSHRAIMYDGFNPSEAARDPTVPFYGKDLPRLPDIEAERDKWPIVSWDITPGDVVLLHPGVLHGGGHTTEGRRRRTLSVRLYGEDIVYAERPSTRPTVPLTPGLKLKLKPGDPLRSPYYPRIRPVPAFEQAEA